MAQQTNETPKPASVRIIAILQEAVEIIENMTVREFDKINEFLDVDGLNLRDLICFKEALEERP